MEHVVDASVNVTKALSCFKANGINAVIRYYNRDMTRKVIRAEEFNAVLASGLSLCIVHQRGGRDPAEYGAKNGTLDAAHCRKYGHDLGQPAGSGIYFAVDFDISSADLNRFVVPYFEAVRAEMANGAALPSYRIGVYGSGLTCRTILDKGLADFTWLSQSRGFRETPQFRASNRWNMLQLMPDTLCGVGVDPDIVNPGVKDFGQFSAAGNGASGGTGHAGLPRFRVIARDGLRLRSGPGVEFPQLRLLALGTLLTEIRRQGDWSFVDTNGDGPLDGAVHNGFLEPA
jgi:hypothetical protein